MMRVVFKQSKVRDHILVWANTIEIYGGSVISISCNPEGLYEIWFRVNGTEHYVELENNMKVAEEQLAKKKIEV